MINTSRWTTNEREIVLAALLNYRAAQRSRKSQAESPIVAADAQWRLVAIGQCLDMIGET